jgi:hypothetical protein
MAADIKIPKTSAPTRPIEHGQSEFETRPEADRPAGGNERDAMFARLQEIVLDGLRHGFFDCVIACELVNQRKRRVIIKAGKSHQFTIREEDLRS